ncbi:MAG: tRNA (adenosine(37)-N6)-threonylcarbamoyltransferase complex ATPase subunit type 1 TsaE [Syntrophomonas sp.]|nr:tRNA (adenosine(37)-N6)-threonylcarbamoyltransferase complex ATPase subunit type 1 TsaE [Syntrophomonas sp.]
MDITIYSEEEMHQLGHHLASVLDEDDVVYLRGELGAGKTVLARGVARGLGYEGRVTSPTFTLMNVYPSTPVIYHFDFYRLESRDLTDLGLEDYLEQGGISLVEWPQVGKDLLPREALWVEIELTDDDYERERKVHILAQGYKYQEKLERLRQIVDFSDR